jgi:hypothetical protein
MMELELRYHVECQGRPPIAVSTMAEALRWARHLRLRGELAVRVCALTVAVAS